MRRKGGGEGGGGEGYTGSVLAEKASREAIEELRADAEITDSDLKITDIAMSPWQRIQPPLTVARLLYERSFGDREGGGGGEGGGGERVR